MDRPLISFVVVSYNQESLIREAVESALAQTYSPLEIIISDDASKDGSFEMIRQTVENYKGTHTIRLNRNSTNLGMGRHLNHVMSLCSGVLVVGAAGDDVSEPDRTEVTYQAWEKSGRRATSIFSSYTTIFLNGDVYGVGGLRGEINDDRLCWPTNGNLFTFLSSAKPVVNGCAHAWSPSLFRYFGPLKSDLEDLVLSFRTLAIGEMLYVNRPLVKYRRHENNVSFFAGGDDTRSFEHRERRLLWVNKQTVAAYDTMLGDIEMCFKDGRISTSEYERLIKELKRVQTYYVVELQMMERSLISRLGVLVKTLLKGHMHCALRCSVRALPYGVYRFLYSIRNRWRALLATRQSSIKPIQIP